MAFNFSLRVLFLVSSLHYIDGAVLNDRSDRPTEVDVVVVGGGYSGLMSAYDLHQSGLKTVVLEAKNRIGGKSRSIQLQSGPGIVELGATWINNKTQPEVFKLTQRFGLETLEQYTDGDSIVQGADGSVQRLPQEGGASDNDSTPLAETIFLGLLNKTIEETNIRRFNEFPEEKDVSFAQWIAGLGLWKDTHVQGLASTLTTIVGREPDEIGAHYFFDYVKSGNGLVSLLTEGRDGAQSLLIAEGTTAIATRLANALEPDSVYVDTPVTKIEEHDGISIVTTATNHTFKARKVVLAITQHLYSDIEFSPPLPCEKNLVAARTRPGNYAKVILSYTDPWWRHAGLVGKFTSFIGPIRYSWETSNPKLSQYSLALFVSGDTATCWDALTEEDQRSAIVEHLAELVGADLADKARDVLEYNFVQWTKEDYIRGAPTSTLGPFMLRKFGKSMREAAGNVHFASTELAYEWKGYLEGAITSGQRAADEVIHALNV
ncbi:monoamine oxidase [Alternaria panax]|uniref:Amine oxidase n=1 Tax=Alternaria panax TaxID=48097 RepID=A0AAD4IEU0_9PLEO|nr:monoamine oxidase [Alternaria panax]